MRTPKMHVAKDGTRSWTVRYRAGQTQTSETFYRESDAIEWAESIGSDDHRMPAEPLLRQVHLRGGYAAVGANRGTAERKALERAKQRGWITLSSADDLSVRLLSMPAVSLWPDYR